MDIGSLGSNYTDYLTTQARDKQTEALRDRLNADYSNATDEELMNACKQFEAYFLEQVFKGMQKTVPESQFSNSSTASLVDYYKDNMIQELAAQSTEMNSIGLAQSMYEQMKRNYSMPQPETKTNVAEESATLQE